MVEPLFFYSADLGALTAGSTATLSGPEAKHAVSVRRMQVGETIQLTDGQGMRIRGNVLSTSATALELKVSEVITEAKPELVITLVQALAKGDRDELAIQAATELGVSAIIPWQASRSISRWDAAKEAKGRARWQQIVNEAGKQSLRAYWPQVQASINTTELAKEVSGFDLVLVLDTTATLPLSSVSIPKAGTVAIVVGPEGGLEASELEALADSGATLVSLGSNVLRTSTAGPAVIAALTLR